MKPAEVYILKQSPAFQEIIFYVCEVIKQEAKGVTLLFKYNIPFFYLNNKPFIYINCPIKKNFVDIGFYDGTHLLSYSEHLNSSNRKMVKSLRYYQIDSIEDTVLRTIIKEAYQYKK